MKIHNTTGIPTNVIALIAHVVMPEGIKVESITVRRKKEGIWHGNWGKYYPLDDTITICLPQVKISKTISTHLQEERHYDTVYEWLASIIGHEMYHAKIRQTPTLNRFTKSVGWEESECESYEQVAQARWIDFCRVNNLKPKCAWG